MENKEQAVPEIHVKDYTYNLPDEKIARYPVEGRDKSKLLVYNGGISERVFNSLPDIIPASSTLVFNNSKVIRARIKFNKSTGASIEVFCLYPASPSTFEESLNAMRFCSWFCTVGNAKKWKNEVLEKEIEYNGAKYTLKARKSEVKDESMVIFEWDAPVNFSKILELCGNVPIPPYLKRDSEQIDELTYQTIFSKHEGSVAAPTAGLHFSERVLFELKNKGISIEEITLHVGAGTFKPMKGNLAEEHVMHKETFVINKETLEHLINKPNDIIAVGTTSVRMLESMYWLGVLADEKEDFNLGQWDAYHTKTDMSVKESFTRLVKMLDKEGVKTKQASTEIMIVPGYKFRTIKGMVTNFHQPESTLILLVAAFIGSKWKDVYNYALNNNFRFLSYGDCTLLMPE